MDKDAVKNTMLFDYSMLIERINKTFGSQGRFAKALGTGRTSVNEALNNKREWKHSEMVASSYLLDFPLSQIPLYFFTILVQKHEPD